MKTLAFAMVAVVGLFVGTSADAAITLGLSSVDDATMRFAGTGSQSTITFTNGPQGNSFGIRTVDGSPGGSPAGLFGTISGSFSYSVAGITTIGAVQTAALTGTGVMSIGPAGGPTLTATISGIDVFSLGSVGGLNGLNSLINLSNVSYSGSNVALLQLKNEVAAGGGIVTISYQFAKPTSLTDLAAAGCPTSTTYSGTVSTVSTVPEPGTMGMAFSGIALLGLGYYRQWRRMRA